MYSKTLCKYRMPMWYLCGILLLVPAIKKSRFQIDSYHEHHQIGKVPTPEYTLLYSVQRGEELLDKEKVTGKEGACRYIYIDMDIIYIYM